MEFAKRNRNAIIKKYVDEGKSSYQVAEELGTYSTKILRALDYLGIERRDYSSAQSSAMEQGRSQHPTRGKKLSEKHKKSIGKNKTEYWKNMPEEERARLSQLSKDAWDRKSSSEKEELRQMALEAVREAGKNGSKTERYLTHKLQSAGYSVVFHKTNLVPHSKLEVDLFIPELRTAIEIDGPAHFLPIWGEEKLQKQQAADLVKQGILMDNGYVVLRIRQVDKTLSITKMENVFNLVLVELQKIELQFPDRKHRLIEVEVNNGETKRV